MRIAAGVVLTCKQAPAGPVPTTPGLRVKKGRFHPNAGHPRRGDGPMRLHSWLGRPKPDPTRRWATRQLTVELLEDRALPSFCAPASYAAGSGPHAVVAADFNGD